MGQAFTAMLTRAFQHTAARRRLAEAAPILLDTIAVSTHSRPKAAGHCVRRYTAYLRLFQHTAARRRLGIALLRWCRLLLVSTHSRPKAAGLALATASSTVSP